MAWTSLPGRDRALDGIEKADELLMGMALHTAAEDTAIERVEGGKQGGCTVALIIMGHGAAAAGFDRQTGLGSVERLDLGFLIDRQNHGMRRRVHIEADNVFDLLGEGGIVGTLERADAMRLEVVCLPNALHRAQRQADRLGHRSAGPVGRFAGRLAAGERQHLGHCRGRHWLFPRRPGLVAQQTVHSGIGVAPLPAPHRRTADAGVVRHLKLAPEYWRRWARWPATPSEFAANLFPAQEYVPLRSDSYLSGIAELLNAAPFGV